MKLSAALLVASILIVPQLANASPPDSPNPNEQIKPGTSTTGGRFQLFQGLYTINAQGNAFSEAGVFKIDSSSGRVWKYVEVLTKDGQLYMKWVPIEQTP